jgi:hydrogenase maturation protease
VKLVIVGIGNILLGDEGVGIRVIEELRKIKLPEYVEIYDGATLGLTLLNFLDGADKAIIVDAVKAGGNPGDVYRFHFKEIPKKYKKMVSLHDLDFPHAVEIGKDIFNIPEDIVVIGIEPERIEESLELSEKVKKAIPKAVELILEEISVFHQSQ